MNTIICIAFDKADFEKTVERQFSNFRLIHFSKEGFYRIPHIADIKPLYPFKGEEKLTANIRNYIGFFESDKYKSLLNMHLKLLLEGNGSVIENSSIIGKIHQCGYILK